MQQASIDRRTKRVQARLRLRVTRIGYNEQARIKEYLLGFTLRNAVLLVLSRVTFIPFEADDVLEIDHGCILP